MADFADRQQKAITSLKAKYEEQLGEEELQNEKLQDGSDHTSSDIWELEKGNNGLRRKADGFQTGNHKLRMALRAAQHKLAAAEASIKVSLEATADDNVEVFAVLKNGRSTQPEEIAAAEGGDQATDN